MKNIVTIGGGTGSFTVLSGLKKVPGISISALVSMADDGGSNKVMRDELGVLPPSDARLCLVALSEHTETVRKLILYRFEEGRLEGQTFGNIFLAALEKITGDFAKGVAVASEILKVKGEVVPITTDKAELEVLLADGKVIHGEHEIDEMNIQEIGIEKFFYKDKVEIYEGAKNAIINADYIIVGPGDIYTSILPNLLVSGFKEALALSKAKIIFPVNLTNKQGHTMGWRVSDYVINIETHLGRRITHILVNTEKPSDEQIEIYKSEERGDVLVEDDFTDERVMRGSFLSPTIHTTNKADAMKRSFIRHDSDKLASALREIIEKQ